MIALLLRVVVLTAIYLMVLTSVHPGDILTGLVLASVLVAVGSRVRRLGHPPDVSITRRLTAVPALVGGTLVDLVRGTWQTAGDIMGRGTLAPGLVEVPIPRCGAPSAAVWGIRVGLSPDTVVVELDEEEGRLLLHVLDARDPDTVVAAQLDSYQRRQRRVFP